MNRALRFFAQFKPDANRERHVTGASLIRVASISLLLFSLLVPAAFAFGWAAGKMAHLGSAGLYASEAVFTLPVVVLCLLLVRIAYDAETDPANQ